MKQSLALYGRDFGTSNTSLSVLEIDCAPAIPKQPKGQYHADEFATVRVGAGDVLTASSSGHYPDVYLYSREGFLMAFDWGKGRILPAGAMADTKTSPASHWNRYPAEYVSIFAGGWDALCISQVSLAFKPDTMYHLTGDIPAGCNYDHRTDSITEIGKKGERPRCFWLDQDHRDSIRTTGISWRPADMVPTVGRVRHWGRHPEFLCNGSPRLHRWSGEFNHKESCFGFAFDRPLRFDAGGLDLDPSRVLNWDGEVEWGPWGREYVWGEFLPKQSDPRRRSSPPPPHPHPHPPPPPADMAAYPRTGAGQIQYLQDHNMTVTPSQRYYLSLFDEKRLRTTHPRLVVSNRTDLAAEHQCTMGQWEGVDYFSPDAGMYCDMRTRAMFPVCSQVRTTRCFDTGLWLLRANESTAVPHVLSKRGALDMNAVVEEDEVLNKTLNDVALWTWQYSNITLLS